MSGFPKNFGGGVRFLVHCDNTSPLTATVRESGPLIYVYMGIPAAYLRIRAPRVSG